MTWCAVSAASNLTFLRSPILLAIQQSCATAVFRRRVKIHVVGRQVVCSLHHLDVGGKWFDALMTDVFVSLGPQLQPKETTLLAVHSLRLGLIAVPVAATLGIAFRYI